MTKPFSDTDVELVAKAIMDRLYAVTGITRRNAIKEHAVRRDVERPVGAGSRHQGGTPMVQIDLEKLKALFDIAVDSLDFGSGFLDNEQVDALREVAVLIGVDPMVGTPGAFRRQYPHAFVAGLHPRDCKVCGGKIDAPGHTKEDTTDER